VRIEDIMTRDVRACSPDDSMGEAAQIMWENDCGCVPVVDGDRRLVGMITDRDICMAAYTRGKPLAEIEVGGAMAAVVQSCRAEDTLRKAETIMRTAQVRRLPVVDRDRVLVGILSLRDIVQEAQRQSRTEHRDVDDSEVSDTLGAICAQHLPRSLQAMA
jgi:CBS domain-containing protein